MEQLGLIMLMLQQIPYHGRLRSAASSLATYSVVGHKSTIYSNSIFGGHQGHLLFVSARRDSPGHCSCRPLPPTLALYPLPKPVSLRWLISKPGVYNRCIQNINLIT